MTTMKARWSQIALVLGAIVITVSVNGNALAEDTHSGYGMPQQQYNAKQQGQTAQGYYDQQYKIPQSYNGKYFPDDDQGAIGYHGTSNSAQNNTQNTTPYYYYY